jgi:RecA-family ATPase
MSASTEELPLFNAEAERALLGSLLIDNRIFPRINFLHQSDFSMPAHRTIFTTCCEMVRRNRLADPCTLQCQLPAELDGVGSTVDYLKVLTKDAATSIGAVSYAQMISELAQRRQGQRDNVIDLFTNRARKSQLAWLDMSRWDNERVPQRKWAIRDRVPLNQVGLFSGEGGTGKSIIELTKDVAHVMGKDWLGSLPEPGPTIYVGAEDDEDEIHIRLTQISRHYGVTFKDLIDGGLHVLCLLGKDATLCAANGKSGKVEVTDLYRQLYQAAGDVKPKNISIDTLSRAFSGNEIDRVQVYAFANYMQALAKVAGGSVTVLSHPSLQGIASGSGISGSTAWHGAFRFRQYLKAVKSDDDDQPDNDIREFQFKKNQYGPLGQSIIVRYRDGLFLPEAGASNLEMLAREAKAEEIFVALLQRLSTAGRNVSHKSRSSNYAPSAFADETEAKSIKLRKADLEGAMRRLFEANKIHVESYGREDRDMTRLAIGPGPE